jgi:hypothetical protein
VVFTLSCPRARLLYSSESLHPPWHAVICALLTCMSRRTPCSYMLCLNTIWKCPSVTLSEKIKRKEIECVSLNAVSFPEFELWTPRLRGFLCSQYVADVDSYHGGYVSLVPNVTFCPPHVRLNVFASSQMSTYFSCNFEDRFNFPLFAELYQRKAACKCVCVCVCVSSTTFPMSSSSKQ